ncbi:MAG TPA: tyrosine-type recombinase/integrase [Blastocatellia bacterium]|nr:tyrosine-type recombinase/integrase [Blastocatellia bacterium]
MTHTDLALSTDLQTRPVAQGWDQRLIFRFCEKSLSDETRRAYSRVIREFFAFLGQRSPLQVTPDDVLAFRDELRLRRKRAATVAFKLAVVRSFFEYIRAAGLININPASTRFVTPPELPDEGTGRALTPKEVFSLLSGPDRNSPEGARDYALLLLMLRMSLRVSEACSLKASSVKWSHGRWVLRVKVKGGRERTLPLPPEVKKAMDDYLKMDSKRRSLVGSGGAEAYLFQPHANYRTLIYDKPLSTRMVRNIVSRWAEYGGVGKLSPHDLRRTAITRALDQGLTYRQVQMMSGHKDPKTVMRYDHGRENLDLNAVNFLKYEDS